MWVLHKIKSSIDTLSRANMEYAALPGIGEVMILALFVFDISMTRSNNAVFFTIFNFVVPQSFGNLNTKIIKCRVSIDKKDC